MKMTIAMECLGTFFMKRISTNVNRPNRIGNSVHKTICVRRAEMETPNNEQEQQLQPETVVIETENLRSAMCCLLYGTCIFAPARV